MSHPINEDGNGPYRYQQEPLPSSPPSGTVPSPDVPVAVVLEKLAHAHKRRAVDVKEWPDKDMWWAGYITALLEVSDWSDAQHMVRELSLRVPSPEEGTAGETEKDWLARAERDAPTDIPALADTEKERG